MSCALSVVIPTHNRQDTLRLCLDALRRQTVTANWELLLVDDGSEDDTAAMAREEVKTFPVPMQVISQPGRGPAVARNRGLAAATGNLILFLDDDILAAPDLVERHLQAHRQHPELTAAVLGYITWTPSLHPTPFMYWLGEKMWFGYGRFAPGTVIDGWAFYSCNVSLKRAFLQQQGGFDERFPSAAFEDTELGWRLQKAGMNLVYHPEAWGHHQQFITFAAACRREQRISAARRIYESTEAGQEDVARRSLRPPKSRWRYMANNIAGRLLLPLRPLLDTHVPLPSSFYRELLKHAARERQPQQG